MKQTSVSERADKLSNAATLAQRNGYTLNVTLVYHNEQTHALAREVYDKVTRLVGKDAVRATWWKIDDLGQPGVLAGAVSTAMRADIIVTALDAAENDSLPFNVWINTWLPNRMHHAGCFVAMVSAPEKAHAGAAKTVEYLRTVAAQGGFDFVLDQRITSPAIQFPRSLLWKQPAAAPEKAAQQKSPWNRNVRVVKRSLAPAALSV
jgi:hypothetical protein